MATLFRVEILTSEKRVRTTEVVSLTAPGSEGMLGVLAHHAPLITALVPGPLILTQDDGRREVYAISGGFLEVGGNRAVVLADALERPQEIDLPRARAAEERARRRLQSREPGIDVRRAEAALRRALSRQQISARWADRRETDFEAEAECPT
ncbi:MAG: F0F1 ATP synthase subunit epsilon [Candidatus Eisenbacteria bacterium]|nr:F0F1 ATP synthase subunit epsilon [Candidatus Eisenbacteria bacterium]